VTIPTTLSTAYRSIDCLLVDRAVERVKNTWFNQSELGIPSGRDEARNLHGGSKILIFSACLHGAGRNQLWEDMLFSFRGEALEKFLNSLKIVLQERICR
jgi:hypothetical protein